MHPKHWLDKKTADHQRLAGAGLFVPCFLHAGRAGRASAGRFGRAGGAGCAVCLGHCAGLCAGYACAPDPSNCFSWPSGAALGGHFGCLPAGRAGCVPAGLAGGAAGVVQRHGFLPRPAGLCLRRAGQPARRAGPLRSQPGAAGRRARRLRAVDDRPFGRDYGLGPAAGRHAGQLGWLRGADLCGCGGQHVHAGRQRPPAAPAAHAGAGVSAAPRGRAAAGTVPLCQPDLCGLFLRQDRGLGHHRAAAVRGHERAGHELCAPCSACWPPSPT